MKLGKAQKALLLVTALFVTFTLVFFLGRRSVHAQITTERAPEELVRELPEPEPGPAPETVPAPTAKERVELNTAGLIGEGKYAKIKDLIYVEGEQ